MVKRRYSNPDKMLLFVMLLVSVLVGCTTGKISNEESVMKASTQNVGAASFPTTTPTPTHQILPTRTLDLFQPDTVRATLAAEYTQIAGQPTSTPGPSPTPTLSPKQLCEPFPDNIQYLGSTQTLSYPAWVIQNQCKGEVTYSRSPVGDMVLFDYTPLTGRFAYGPPNHVESGLWVYDYWIGFSEKWWDGKVTSAKWSPIKDVEGIQKLAILQEDGTLFILSGPFQSSEIGKNVDYFSFSPAGDQIAFVKNEILYIVSVRAGQPRKLAEQVYGTPAWALEQNAIICPSSPIKIVKLDGSGLIIPEEMRYITKRAQSSEQVMQILWDGKSRLLVFHTSNPLNEPYTRTLYVYELSEDLRSIVNLQFLDGEFDAPFTWEIPGTTILDASGTEIRISPSSDIFTVEARITSIEDNRLGVEFVWAESKSPVSFFYQFSNVLISDQTQILDTNGNITTLEALQKGMTMELTTRMLSPNTLSLFAYKIQILCEEGTCYLGIEGRS
ncbi:MAG: hypothetical protein A2Z14_17685 [Chloroflexi bacterium RBG_16_48_8]|nr:MAG: hypothetical protein A2Z14_17685 [Chloroflexi bacterium RBG_16_48_8]